MAKKNLAAAAQAVTDKFFSAQEEQAPRKVIETIPPNSAYAQIEAEKRAQESRQNVRTGKSSPAQKDAEKAGKAGKKAPEPVKVFSFRAAVRDVDQWRLYAAIRGEKVDEIGAAAMREYLKRHPLSAEEKALFDKRIENMKS